MGHYRKYSDEEKAQALLALEANGGNLLQTSRQTGVPLNTIKGWRDGVGVSAGVANIRNETRKPLEEKLEDLIHLLLDAIPEKIAEADLKAVNVAAGILFDKRQLLRGEPTSVEMVRSDGPTDAERADRVAALLDRGRERRAGQAPLPTVQ